MTRWFFARPHRPAVDESGPATSERSEEQDKRPTTESSTSAEAQLKEVRTSQAQLRHEMAELLKAHRQRARTLERTQKALEQTERELTRHRNRGAELESQLAGLRQTSEEQAARIHEAEGLAEQHATMKAANETSERERKDLGERVTDLTSRVANLDEERNRLAADLATSHATIAARDAEVAGLKVELEGVQAVLTKVQSEIAELTRANAALQADLEKAVKAQAAHNRVQLEYDALSARWDVARAQLAEAEQALKTSQATIKAAQHLSSSVEWRSALDGVLDAASELVRFDRGTLALVDELQDELKVEAARNSPIAISEMSRFKVGEGIAGWALSHREPVLVRDSRNDARFKASDPKHQPRSFIAVPLLAGKEGLGVLTLARTASDPFTEHDLRNLARVAADAANALINARLVDLLKQREDRLTTLVRKTRELSSANDSKQLVEFVLSSACELLGGTAALLALRGVKNSELEVVGSVGMADFIIQQRIAWGAPAANDVMRTGKPWVAPMREMLPTSLVDTVEKAGLLLMASVLCGSAIQSSSGDEGALLSRSELENTDQVSGVLNVYRDSVAPIAPGDLEQLKAFAEQAAIALYNVRRWDKVKEQLQTSASMNTRLMGRERYINQLLFRIQQLEQELGRYKAA